MIITVKNTKMSLVLPDGYKKIKARNPLKELQNSKDGVDAYQKMTPEANCVTMINKIDEAQAMPFDDCQRLIDDIHSMLSGTQGLIAAESGITERGYRFIYSIIRTIGIGDSPNGATYFLRLNLENDGEYAEIRADFSEVGMTGMRGSLGFDMAQNANLICPTDENPMAGWREDPYDNTYCQGLPMNLSEREGLDGIFPNHPVSQAREFVHAILWDELMLCAEDSGQGMQTSITDVSTISDIVDIQSVNDPSTCEDNISAIMTQEEMYRWMLSKDVKRRFVPLKIEVEPQKEKRKLPSINLKKTAIATKDGVAKAAGIVQEKGREAQMSVLTFVDKKKNTRFLTAKMSAFKDGMNAGKTEAVEYIKKYANFCLASTAVSYYFARCDGSIDENEMLEIEHDLDSIIKNKDLPESLRNKLAEISEKQDLTFAEVCSYLDGVGIDTLKEFAIDIDEIIMADEKVTPEEEAARAEFQAYLAMRMEAEQE